MTFEDWWENLPDHIPLDNKTIARSGWYAARPDPLTEDEIRESWRECGHSAPMAFAQALQKKLGILG